ncbi:MAG: polysaccharide pyruvyl transferase CsaB [Clostridia bacterium]|nr:polysaccharide pyruvyl transferase CsaB [Clostridia bacterium]
MSDIIISGYHGFSNSGDEALLYAILATLRKKRSNLDVTVLSKVPEETSMEYGVKSIYRYNFHKIKKEMKQSKMLLFGGGSLLQDVTSSKSILYYLAIISMAKKCGMKTMLYANGIGPIVKKRNRRFAAKILNQVDIITLRDDRSDEELRSLGVTKPEIIITADPAFTIDTDVSLSGRYYTNRAGVPDGTKLCVVSIRDFKTLSGNFDEQMATLCDHMVNSHGVYPLFVPMQYPADMDISQRVMQNMKNKSYVINRELSVAEMFSVLSEAQAIIGMRLHSLIYATTLAIPAMALVYDPKVSAFMESLSQPDWVDVENFDTQKAMSIFDTVMFEKDKRHELLKETNQKLKKMAEENATYAIKLLDSAEITEK